MKNFSKVKLDYQNWDGGTRYGMLSFSSSNDGSLWTPFIGNIKTRNGLNRLPLTKEVDLSGLKTKYVRVEMSRDPGSW